MSAKKTTKKAAKATRKAAKKAPAKKAAKTVTRKAASQADAIAAGELRWQPAPSKTRGATRSGETELPISEKQARKVTRWLMSHFGTKIRAAGEGTQFTADIICAIACQETAYFWLPLLEKLETKSEFKDKPTELADLILARCVLDASGDFPGAGRSAFPKNTATFLAAYGKDFTRMLIDEANETRALRGFGPKEWVYKGYGLFQYDLQFVEENESFFRERKWYDFEACLANCMGELKSKFKITKELWAAVEAYNGKGPRARAYRKNVQIFAAWTKDEISKLPAPPAATRAVRGGNVPKSKPQLDRAGLAEKLAPFAIDRTKYPLIVVGIRGYYMDTMGEKGVNDRGIYDDAIFIDSDAIFASFNGNTDPSRYRPGSGTGDAKGIAKLKAGDWYAHKLDYHGSKVYGPYRAICQRLGKVTVLRDGKNGSSYEETGNFGINIHRGSANGTSSEGCQTIHPDQWPSFIATAMDLAKRYYGDKWDEKVIPYILIEA